MRVECSNCHKVFEIPDERLPKGKQMAFPCPACQGTIELDLRAESGQAGGFRLSNRAKRAAEGRSLKKEDFANCEEPASHAAIGS